MNKMIQLIPLQTSDREFEALFELNPVPMLVNHADSLKFLAVNQAALDLYGLEREALLGRPLQDLLHPGD